VDSTLRTTPAWTVVDAGSSDREAVPTEKSEFVRAIRVSVGCEYAA
jgi:hypothetical protein